jgi:hypothetical protein
LIARTARQFPLIAALVVVLALAPIALAGKGGGGGHKPGGTTGGSSNLSLVMLSDTGTAGVSWGDTVTFSFQQSATTEPHVDLTCSQGGTVVYGATAGFYASYPWPWTVNMTLSSQSWSAGSASCIANLYYFNGSSKVSLGSLSFTAAG